MHSEQLKLSSVEDNDCNNARKKRLAANNEQERQLNKEKLQAWKVSCTYNVMYLLLSALISHDCG